MEKHGIPSVTLVTQIFEALGRTVAKGRGMPDLQIHVMPHPLNPLPEAQVRQITRDHADGIVEHLLRVVEAKKK